MKKILAFALCLVMVLSLSTMAFAATETKTITYDFANLAVGSEITDDALDVFKAATTDTQLVSVSVSKVYAGNNTDSGAHQKEAGFLKLGSSKAKGQIVLTYGEDVKVVKVDVYCHDWYTKNAEHPTNSNKVSVNGSAEVLAPYNETGACEVRSFDLTATNVVTIDSNKRIFISKIVVYTEVEVAGGDGDINNPPAGDMIAVALAALAVSGMGIAVVAKKKEF